MFRIAQIGIVHAHAAAKVDVLRQRSDVDFVGAFVETTPLDNLARAKRVVTQGKHVLIDKPPSPSLEGLREVLAIASLHGCHVQMGYQFRFLPAFEFIIDWARSGHLGHIFQLRAHIQTNRSVYSRWYPYVSKFPRGVLFEHDCHMVDLVVAILGAPTQCLCVISASTGLKEPSCSNRWNRHIYGAALPKGSADSRKAGRT